MKSLTLSAAIAAALVAATASAQTAAPFALAKCDAEALTFNDVRLPQAVLANGQALAAGIYQLRITAEHPAPAAGQSPMAECWVEFLKGGAVVAREVASVVPADEIGAVAEGPGPKPSAARVDLLKEGEYLRVWLNSAGTHYIVNMPVARTTTATDE